MPAFSSSVCTSSISRRSRAKARRGTAMSPHDGLQSPTLHLFPGDQLIIHFHNDLPAWNATPMPKPHVPSQDADCTMTRMDPSFTNLHFHGMTIPPVCHQDDVMNTAIPTGQEFEYRVAIPRDEAPGVYWYHPHPHGYSERQVQGGAAGALIVEGLSASFHR